MRQRILELLRARPFQSFRIHLSNGTVHVVRHPDQLLVAPTYLLLGVTANGAPGPEISDSAFVSLIHGVRVEVLSPATPSPAN
jgi:hypothetical protein